MGNLHPGEEAPAPTAVRREGAASAPARTGPGPHVLSCDTLSGEPVMNPAGEALGTLAHVMLDVSAGRIAYGVVAYGGVFGIGERLFAVPWELLTVDDGRKCLLLDIPRERFEHAPGFDKDHWPSMHDAQWARNVRSFFGDVRPERSPRLQ